MTKVTKAHQQHTQTSKQEKQQTVLLLFLFKINTLLSLRNAALITSPEIVVLKIYLLSIFWSSSYDMS